MQRNISHWEGLRARVLVSTADRGKRAALARELGVARQTVSGWLLGLVAPNAEMTLRLLEWVTAAEAKQEKNAENVSEARPARRETQKRKTRSNAKPRSSRTRT